MNVKTIKSFTALVFNMRLIRKNDRITGQPSRAWVLPVSKGCLVVIISKGFYMHIISLTLVLFWQGKIHNSEQVGDWDPY